MSSAKLLRLREWLDLPEAASHLSAVLQEPIAVADLLLLGLEGQLPLSLHLPTGHSCLCQQGHAEKASLPVRQPVEGIWDLVHEGAGRRQLEHEYHWLKDLSFISMEGCRGALVQRDGLRCQLSPDPGATGFAPRSASAFPEGSLLVLRKTVLDEFAAKHDRSVERPLDERERVTLLAIIAVLAEAAGIDLSKPSPAADKIEKLIELRGAKVSSKTIFNHLREVDDALERKKPG